MGKKIVLIGLLIFIGKLTLAQRTWIETEFSINLLKKLEFSLSPEVRFKHGFELKEYFIEPSLEYKFSNYFRLATAYRLGYNINKKDEHEPYGRFRFDAKTGFKWRNFNPKFRLRYTNADDFSDDNENIKYLRYKLKLEYKLKALKTEPYLLYEWYHDLDKKEISKGRFETGLLFKVNQHHKIGGYYRNNNYLTSDKEVINIGGVVYKFKL